MLGQGTKRLCPINLNAKIIIIYSDYQQILGKPQ